ncbi:MAG: Ribokinase [Anaerolineae bacterium]|nr:MAG: Ribokinase [Anaerolineae bacterium]
MKQGIVVVGSINMDLVVRAPRLPQLGETLLGGDFRTFPGGKGANQAVACARLGAKVSMVGRVGKDSFGDQLLAGIAENGVNIAAVERDSQEATGVALITVTEDGNNAIVVAPGANGRLTPQDVLRSQALFEEAEVLVLQLECPLAAVEQAIQLAKSYQMRVVLNPAPAQPLRDELVRSVDFLIPNQTELQILAGETATEKAIDHLLSLGVQNLILTLGEEGAMIVDQNQRTRVQAYKVQAVDTTAAGDAFVGAFAVAISQEKSILEAVQMGVAAGALAVTKAGAQPSLPTWQELQHFMATQPEPAVISE